PLYLSHLVSAPDSGRVRAGFGPEVARTPDRCIWKCLHLDYLSLVQIEAFLCPVHFGPDSGRDPDHYADRIRPDSGPKVGRAGTWSRPRTSASAIGTTRGCRSR